MNNTDNNTMNNSSVSQVCTANTGIKCFCVCCSEQRAEEGERLYYEAYENEIEWKGMMWDRMHS